MRYLIIISVLALTMSCSSKQSAIQYYLLDPPSHGRNLNLHESKTIKLTQLNIPEYLKQAGMPLALDTNRVHISKTHVWAEPFDTSITRLLQYEFEPDYVLIAHNAQAQPDLALSVDILHLIPTQNGEVFFSATYQIKRDGELLVRRAYTKSYPLAEDGYSHAVDVYRKAIREFATEITANL